MNTLGVKWGVKWKCLCKSQYT